MMRSFGGLWLASILLMGFALPATAAYVFFHQVRGDWAVVCWREIATEKKHCRLSAPPAALSLEKRGNELIVHEYAADTFQIAVQLYQPVDEQHGVFLRIDKNIAHEASVQNGLARWAGDSALRILAEMRAGGKLVFRIHTVPDALPQDTFVSLEGFDDALSTYRREVRRHGLLTGGS